VSAHRRSQGALRPCILLHQLRGYDQPLRATPTVELVATPTAAPGRTAEVAERSGPDSSSWIPELDGLRALAALCVVIVHHNAEPLQPATLSAYSVLRSMSWLAAGSLGVVFFYALSAFLLTYLGVREFQRTGTFSLRKFYLRRIFRIWPLYFTLLCIGVIVSSPDTKWLASHLWQYLAFLSNWSLTLDRVGGYSDASAPPLSILWSIAVEEQFYLVYPILLLAAFTSLRSGLRIVVVAILIAWLFRGGFQIVPDSAGMGAASWSRMYYSTLTYLDVFAAGAVVGWLVAHAGERSSRILDVLRQPGAGALLIAAIVSVGIAWRGHAWYPDPVLPIIVYGSTGAVFACVIGWVVVNRGSLVARFLRSRPMTTLGALSYGMYLWHPIGDVWVRRHMEPLVATTQADVDFKATASLLIYVAAAVVGAALTFGLVEQPFLRLKARIGGGGMSSAATSARADARPNVPWWLALVGGLLVLVLTELTVEAYFGSSPLGRLSLLTASREVLPVGASGLEAFYVPQAGSIQPGQSVVDASASSVSVRAQDLVFVGNSGQLWRATSTGAVQVTASTGQRVRVTDLGGWDPVAGRFTGLDAVYDGSRWAIDSGSFAPANPNSDLSAGGDTQPPDGFWISPADAGYRLTRVTDAGHRVLRLEVTSAAPYLVLNGQGPLATLDNAPVDLRGEVRASSNAEMRLTLYDVVGPDGRAETFVDRAAATSNWTSLRLRGQRVHFPNASDNFSLGLADVRPGDWLEIRDLALYVGAAP
jgi:peptidoglycan/LPS O-acetylase OafA/YrhL